MVLFIAKLYTRRRYDEELSRLRVLLRESNEKFLSQRRDVALARCYRLVQTPLHCIANGNDGERESSVFFVGSREGFTFIVNSVVSCSHKV